MNQQVKLKWVEALRSGKYKKTRKQLRDDNGYCCLGVLCDLYKQDVNTPDSNWHRKAYNFIFETHAGESTQHLPEPVFRWAGLTDGNPDSRAIVKDEDGTLLSTLSGINDYKYGFNEIADLIERNF